MQAGLQAPQDNAGLESAPGVLAPVPALPTIDGVFAPLPSLRGFTAIFGGSFNPPHLGHQAVCEHLVRTMHADEVWLTPVYVHVDGKSLTDFTHRVAMCEAMAEPYGGRVRVSLAEQEHGMPASLTSDLLRYLKRRHTQRHFAFVAGADVAKSMPEWEGWDYIAKTTHVHVIDRTPVSSTEVRRRIAEGEPIDDVVPKKVVAYLNAHGLYASNRGLAAA